MKDITSRLVELFRSGFCTPQISRIAKKMHEPSTTIQYNVKKMEKEGTIKAYKAVFDYKKIGMGHCVYLLGNLGPKNYSDPEKVADELANHPNVESIDIVTGDYEVLIKLRIKDTDEYYELVKYMAKKYGFMKTYSITSLKQVKTEFVVM